MVRMCFRETCILCDDPCILESFVTALSGKHGLFRGFGRAACAWNRCSRSGGTTIWRLLHKAHV